MNEKLQQAIAAARNGQSTEAQLLLTQVLKADPNETQAWFLLSTLVESKEKKVAYLGKVLALNPQHEMAQQLLARMQDGSEVEEVEEVAETAVTPPPMSQEIKPEEPAISTEPTDFMAQEMGDTIPDWLADEEEIQQEQIEPDQTAVEPVVEPEIPDWLQEEENELAVDEPMVPSDSKQPESDPVQTVQKAVVPTKEDQEKQKTALTRILYSLIIATVIILIIMIYLIITTI